MSNPLRRTIAVASLLSIAGASAYGAPEPNPAALVIGLDEFPSFLGPSDTLRFVLEITNPDNASAISATELSVTVSFRASVRNRSTLKRTFDAKPALPVEIGSETFALDGGIGVGESRQFTISSPLAQLSFFRGRTASGVYPLQITVSSAKQKAVPLQTYLIFFVPDGAPQLGVSLVIPLHSPSIYTDSERPDVVTSISLERSIDGGRISRILDGLEANADIPIAIAPSGLLLDTLSDLSDGFTTIVGRRRQNVSAEDPRALSAARTLGRIRALAVRPTTEVVLFAYSAAVLPALIRADLPGRAQTQVRQTQLLLDANQNEGAVKVESAAAWFLPVAGLADEPTLTLLQQSSIDHTILSARSLRSPGDPLKTRPGPVQIKTRSSSAANALIFDSALSERLIGSTRPIESRQRFLAETLTIMLEFPGQTRAVVGVAAENWSPDSVFVGEVFSSLGRSPWLAATTPTRLFAALAPKAKPLEIGATNDLLDKTLPSIGVSIPPIESFAALKQAQGQIKRYAELDPPRARLARLDRRLLISESSDWWTNRARIEVGRRFATAVGPAIRREFDAVRAPAKQTITLTSRTGVIPLSIRSDLAYPVDIVVRLRSSKLGFPTQGDVRTCNDASRTTARERCLFIDKLPPRSPPILVFTEAQATGTFALHLLVETPGGIVLDESDLIIKSTAYSGVAVAITAGAAIFLVAWWIGGLARKRVAG